MQPYFFGFAFRPTLATSVLEITNQFLLLCIDRNDRKSVSEVLLSLLVDMFELGVAFRVARSFERLLVRLQAISELTKQLVHELVTHLMTFGLTLLGGTPDALPHP